MWLRLSRNGGGKPHSAILLLVAVLSLGAAAVVRAEAQADALPGHSLKQMLEWLDAHHPELAASRLERDAAAARVQPAGALPDPMLSVEWRDIRYDSPTLDPTQVGAMRYQFRQSIPLWGKRDLRSQVAEAGVTQAAAKQGQTRLVLRNRLKRAYTEWVAARETLRHLDELQRLLEDAERLLRGRYAASLAGQAEVLRAQMELASLKNDQATTQAEVQRARVRINALLLRPSDAPLAEPTGFAPLPKTLDWSRWMERLDGENPQLQLLAAQVEAGRHSAELVRRNRWPDLTVGVAPMQTGSRFDTFELMLEINLPLQRESRRQQEREAGYLVAAAEARRAALAASLKGELAELAAGYDAALHHLHVLKTTLLPQVELTWRAAYAAYAGGGASDSGSAGGDYAALIEAQRAWKKARIDAVMAERDAHLALAEIELRVGGDL